MKNLVLNWADRFPGVFWNEVGRLVWTLFLVFAGGLATTTQSIGQVSVISEKGIYGDPVSELTFDVEYYHADTTTLGDGDIWAFGYDGIATPVELVKVRSRDWHPGPDPQPAEPGDEEVSEDPSQLPLRFLPKINIATYRIPHPDGEDAMWTAEQNQRFALLLEPQQVKRLVPQDGYFNHQHLGFLNLRIGEEPPVIKPESVDIDISYRGESYLATIKIKFASRNHFVRYWGEVVVEDNRVSLPVVFGDSDDHSGGNGAGEVIRIVPLPELKAGEYIFFLTQGDDALAQQEFEVEDLEPIGAEVSLEAVIGENGQQLMVGEILFDDPYFVIEDPGIIQRTGGNWFDGIDDAEFQPQDFPGVLSFLEINLKAVRATFVREPDHKPFPLRYEIPDLPEGVYVLTFNVNGSRAAAFDFRLPVVDPAKKPKIHAFTAEPEEVRLGQPVTLKWEVANSENITISPGIGRVEGDSIVVTPSWDTFFPEPIADIILHEVIQSDPEASIVSLGSEWRYSDRGAAPSGDWTELDYDDAEWKSGKAQLGYGDGDEETVISFGEDPEAKHTAAYFRHVFKYDGTDDRPLGIYLLRDDGAVVYINGTEVLRNNMPNGKIKFSTLALDAALRDGNGDRQFVPIDPSTLKPGENVIAVEVHQVRPSSTDLSFDLALVNSDVIDFLPHPGESYDVTYTLTAANEFGRAQESVNIVVHVGGVDPEPTNTATIEFFEEDGSHFANVMVIPAPNYQIIQWGELNASDGHGWKVQVELNKVPEEDFFPGPAPEPLENVYRLGELKPGTYTFSVSDGQHVIGQARLRVDNPNGGSEVPGVQSITRPIVSPDTDDYSFVVRYEVEGGINTESLGDDDIFIVPFLQVDVPAARVATYPAELEDFEVGADSQVDAIYHVEFPDDFFTNIQSMQFEVYLTGNSVIAADGGLLEGGRVGFIDVNIEGDDRNPIVKGHVDSPVVSRPDQPVEMELIIESEKVLNPLSLETGAVQVFRVLDNGDKEVLGVPEVKRVSPEEDNSPQLEAGLLLMPPDSGWTKSHNGQWGIELTAGGLTFADGSPIPAMKLGVLTVRISGDTTPHDRLEVEMDPIETNTHYGVDLYIKFPPTDRRAVDDWGTPVNVDGTFEIRATSVTRETLDALPHKQSHRYLIARKSTTTVAKDIEYKVEESRDFQVEEEHQIVLHSEDQWHKWTANQTGDREIAFKPPVDFEERTLIGVFAGAKTTGGYGISIEKISHQPDFIQVEYIETIPGIHDPVTDAFTYPYQWVSIEKTPGPYSFSGEVIALPGPAPEGEAPDGTPEVAEFTAISEPDPHSVPVVWYLDDEPLYKIHLRIGGNSEEDEGEDLKPSDASLSVTLNENVATIQAMADFTGSGVPVTLTGWSELEFHERKIVVNLEVAQSRDIGIPTPGAPPVFEESFTTTELKPGHYRVDFRVNGEKVAHTFFLVGGDDPFLKWLGEHLHGHGNGGEEPPQSSPDEIVDENDADGDGWSDFHEWAFVLDPTKPDRKSPVTPGIIQRNGKSHFSFEFNFRGEEMGVTYVIEGSNNLLQWERVESTCTVLAQSTNPDNSHHISICLDQAIDEIPTRFVRVRGVPASN